jgi:hypothetical protein
VAPTAGTKIRDRASSRWAKAPHTLLCAMPNSS